MFFLGENHPVLYGLSSIHRDTTGYYYLAGKDDYWTCPRCEERNPGPYTGKTCRVCGFPIWN